MLKLNWYLNIKKIMLQSKGRMENGWRLFREDIYESDGDSINETINKG